MPKLSVVAVALAAVLLVPSPARSDPPRPKAEEKPMVDAAPEPFAKLLQKFVKHWPQDLTVSFRVSSGGMPPTGSGWSVDSSGVGKMEWRGYEGKDLKSKTWPIALDLADLEALVSALSEVDFEQARRPVPESPARFVGISSGGRQGTIDLYGLTDPKDEKRNSRIANAVDKLSAQGQKASPAAPAGK